MKKTMTMIAALGIAIAMAPVTVSASHEGVGQWCSPNDRSQRCINVYACVRAGWDRYTCEARHKYD